MREALIWLLPFALGVCLGSFLNVVALRYGSRKGVVWERSACAHCQRPLRWWELLPLVSYVILRGRCATCRRLISLQYPLVELLTGLVVVIIWVPPFEVTQAVLKTAIAACLIVLGLIDFRTMLLPDRHLLVLSAFVVLFLIVFPPLSVLQPLGGIAIGAGFLLLLWVVTRGQGLGLGDVKLMIPLGALFGVPGIITMLFIAFMVGGFLAVLLLLSQRAGMKSAIPFGPLLAASALVILLFPVVPHYFFSIILGTGVY